MSILIGVSKSIWMIGKKNRKQGIYRKYGISEVYNNHEYT